VPSKDDDRGVPVPVYERNPRYPAAGGTVAAGWEDPVARLPRHPVVLAIDGPGILDWDTVVDGLCRALDARGLVTRRIDLRNGFSPWPEILRATTSPALAEDPDFERLPSGALRDLFLELPPTHAPPAGVTVAYGPGAALLNSDQLWYVDLPKRYAEAEVAAGRGRNLGQQSGDGVATTKRLFYVDWPLLDRHRDGLAARIDRWVDAQDPEHPTSVDGPTLRATMQMLAGQPFRTRPTFNTTPWGGRWAQRQLGFNPDAVNTALGYELIAPESGVLVGDSRAVVELPFQLIVATHPRGILGEAVHEMFGTSFPIRFDYLDTVDGGNLSVHCHPRPAYMTEIFGWAYPQHETYYVMVGGRQGRVFLGLRDDVDLAEFHRRADKADHGGEPFEIERFVQAFPAEPHRLFCVPVGTPHGSSAGNVVLEVSATPYLYSLRFYDWLRRDGEGRQRPVHVQHAFENLDSTRTGAAVRSDLVQSPRTLREESGWREDLLGSLPEMFFEVRRVELSADRAIEDDTAGRFHVINVVEGDGVVVEPVDGSGHGLTYAETLVIPAAVGRYRLRNVGRGRVRVVKSLVR
jgi:mannose-6-phosphate isomerase class I